MRFKQFFSEGVAHNPPDVLDLKKRILDTLTHIEQRVNLSADSLQRLQTVREEIRNDSWIFTGNVIRYLINSDRRNASKLRGLLLPLAQEADRVIYSRMLRDRGQKHGLVSDSFHYSQETDNGRRVMPHPTNFNLRHDTAMSNLLIHPGNLEDMRNYIDHIKQRTLRHLAASPRYIQELTNKVDMVEMIQQLSKIPQSEQFVNALWHNPTDDRTWGVAADWLEETGKDDNLVHRMRVFIKHWLVDSPPEHRNKEFHWSPNPE